MTYASVSRNRTWLAVALAVVVAAFLVYSLPPYFTGDPGQSRVPPTFSLHYPLLVGHILVSSVAMVGAVAQIWPRLRRRHPGLHRRVGRVYVWTAIPAALSAIVLGAATPFGPILAASNVVLGSLWLWFTVSGYLAARRRRFADHRRQMIRSATLALSIITNRLWGLVLAITLDPLHGTVFGGNDELFGWVLTGAVGWLGWTVPLAVVHVWVLRRPAVPHASDVSRPDTQWV